MLISSMQFIVFAMCWRKRRKHSVTWVLTQLLYCVVLGLLLFVFQNIDLCFKVQVAVCSHAYTEQKMLIMLFFPFQPDNLLYESMTDDSKLKIGR